MLDKLVESRNKQENGKLKLLLITISTATFSGVIFALIFSLFSQNLAMGGDQIVLSSLITPPQIIEEKVPPKKVIKKTTKSPKKNQKILVATRVHKIQSIKESPQKTPNKTSTSPSKYKARPDYNYEVGRIDKDVANEQFDSSTKGDSRKIDTVGFISKSPKETKKPKKEIKKPIKKKTPPPPPIKKTKKPIVVTKGVINGTAKNLVKPTYSAAAKTAGAKGKVTVQVLINEQGKVISAKATNGHILLKRHAEIAARKSRFTPTYLSEVKVKVRGVIVYNFR